MSALVFDIETVGENFSEMDETTQDALTRWIKKSSDSDEDYKIALQELKDGLGFSPLTGFITAIGVLDVEKNKGAIYFQAPGTKQKEFEEDGIKFKPMAEKEMLESFWNGAKEYDEIVSFNGRSFDAPFLIIRSAICGVRPAFNPMPNRYLESQRYGVKHVDLFDQLTFYGAVWRQKGNLHTWCRAFGIKSPKEDGVTGDMVGDLFKQKRFADIARYNVGDLRATKELYDKWKNFVRF